MQKIIVCLLLISFVGCNTSADTEPADTVVTDSPLTDIIAKPVKDTVPAQEVHANKRFRNVTVQKTGPTTFEIAGEGQIFEASFSWVIEDGHNELQQGHEMTDAGAPEWGKFRFSVDAKKARENSTLHIILYEISAKDGSRQHELPIKLY